MTLPKHKNQVELLVSPVPQTLKKMTVPMIYGMVLLMSFNLIDTFFVSLLGTQSLAAISFTFPITFTVISLSIGLGIGTSAVVARYLGKGDLNNAKLAATTSLYITTIIVSTLALLGHIFTEEIFLALGATVDTLPLIHQYMDVWFFSCVFLMGPMIGNAILRASGDTKTPSMIMGCAGLINAILDPILIFGFGPIPEMGIQGAAIATLLSWIFGLSFSFYLIVIKKQLVYTKLLALKEVIFSGKEILKIGLPAAGANMLTPIAAAVLTAIAAKFGEPAVAAFGVGTRIESIACLVVLALSMTLPPFISQNFGASNMARVEEGYKVSTKFVLYWQLFIYVILIVAAPFIAHAFAKEEKVAELIVLFIWILPLGYGLQGIVVLTNSSFNALHKPMTALVLSIVRLFICYVPLAYIGSLLFDIQGFFVGALIGNLLMAGISYHYFTKQFKQIIEHEVIG